MITPNFWVRSWHPAHPYYETSWLLRSLRIKLSHQVQFRSAVVRVVYTLSISSINPTGLRMQQKACCHRTHQLCYQQGLKPFTARVAKPLAARNVVAQATMLDNLVRPFTSLGKVRVCACSYSHAVERSERRVSMHGCLAHATTFIQMPSNRGSAPPTISSHAGVCLRLVHPACPHTLSPHTCSMRPHPCSICATHVNLLSTPTSI